MNSKSGGTFNINSIAFDQLGNSKSTLQSIFTTNNITSFNISDFSSNAKSNNNNIRLDSSVPLPKSNIYRVTLSGLYKESENKFLIKNIGKTKEFIGGSDSIMSVTINIEKLNKLGGSSYEKYMKYKLKYMELKSQI